MVYFNTEQQNFNWELSGDIPSCMYPFIYPSYCSYFTFVSLHLHLLVTVWYDLTLSCSQYIHSFISLLLEPPCLLLAVATFVSLHRLPTLFRVPYSLSLQVALTRTFLRETSLSMLGIKHFPNHKERLTLLVKKPLYFTPHIFYVYSSDIEIAMQFIFFFEWEFWASKL